MLVILSMNIRGFVRAIEPSMAGLSDLRAVNLNLLPALDALLRDRHVSAAARRMGVSQSAMSHALSKLRLLLDDKLLVAFGRAMVLTPRGEQIAAVLPRILHALSDVIAQPEPFAPSTSRRAFVLATVDYFELTTLGSVLAFLCKEAPHVQLNIERTDSESLARLKAGQIDLLVSSTSGSLTGSGLRSRRLFDEPFAVIARSDHPTIKRRLSLSAYLKAQHVLVTVERRSEGLVDRVLAERGLSRHIAVRVPHFLSAPIAVQQSDLICTLAASVAERAREVFGVRVLSAPLEIPPVSIHAWWPVQHDGDPARTWFRDAICSGRALSPAIRRRMRASKGS